MSIYFEKPQKHPIDTSNWKMFRVGDLFEVSSGNYTPTTGLIEDPEGINMVSVTQFNNGVVGRYKREPGFKVYPAGMIVWGKQNPHLFLQMEEFITNQSIYMFDASSLTKYAALFLIAVIQKVIEGKYNYGNNLIGSRMEAEQILLPVDSDGNPDWNWMDKAARDIEERSTLIQAIKQNRK